MLSSVLCYAIENYVFIEYLCCHYKTLSVISSDEIFEKENYNGLLGIGIPEVLRNLVSCHGFTKKADLTVILVYPSHLVNYYIAKGFAINENKYNQLISVLNDMKPIINSIDKQKTYYFMACTIELSLV